MFGKLPIQYNPISKWPHLQNLIRNCRALSTRTEIKGRNFSVSDKFQVVSFMTERTVTCGLGWDTGTAKLSKKNTVSKVWTLKRGFYRIRSQEQTYWRFENNTANIFTVHAILTACRWDELLNYSANTPPIFCSDLQSIFYRIAEHGSCRGMWRRIEASGAINLARLEEWEKNTLYKLNYIWNKEFWEDNMKQLCGTLHKNAWF